MPGSVVAVDVATPVNVKLPLLAVERSKFSPEPFPAVAVDAKVALAPKVVFPINLKVPAPAVVFNEPKFSVVLTPVKPRTCKVPPAACVVPFTLKSIALVSAIIVEAAALPLTSRIPLVTVVLPVYVFTPVSAHVPASALVTEVSCVAALLIIALLTRLNCVLVPPNVRVLLPTPLAVKVPLIWTPNA